VANRLRTTVLTNALSVEGAALLLSASIGVAWCASQRRSRRGLIRTVYGVRLRLRDRVVVDAADAKSITRLAG
jgi:hypothetical protein